MKKIATKKQRLETLLKSLKDSELRLLCQMIVKPAWQDAYQYGHKVGYKEGYERGFSNGCIDDYNPPKD